MIRYGTMSCRVVSCRVLSWPLLSTLIYSCLLLSTLVYSCLLLSTLVYSCLLSSTLVYSCLPSLPSPSLPSIARRTSADGSVRFCFTPAPPTIAIAMWCSKSFLFCCFCPCHPNIL